jgi:predicted negative regulator of RcsB-dependent stress response
VEVYTTENEQVDVLRRFFIENGKALAIGVVLALIVLGGWRYWQYRQNTNQAELSIAYQQALNTMTGKENAGINELKTFSQGNNNNYGAFADLQLASHFVEQKDYAGAEKQLLSAQSKVQDGDLASLISFRLARIQLQENKVDDALKTLDGLKGAGWEAMQQSVRGDALLLKGDAKGAKEAYSKALTSNVSSTLQSILQIKLNNLSS